jgi:hypothetical protein
VTRQLYDGSAGASPYQETDEDFHPAVSAPSQAHYLYRPGALTGRLPRIRTGLAFAIFLSFFMNPWRHHCIYCIAILGLLVIRKELFLQKCSAEQLFANHILFPNGCVLR